jgi:hypothetical protein
MFVEQVIGYKLVPQDQFIKWLRILPLAMVPL